MRVHLFPLAIVIAAVALWCPLRAQSSGYYRPVAPPPARQPPCGHVGTAPCPVPQPSKVTIPPGATPDQVYQMALQAQRRRDIPAKMQYMELAAALGQINAMTGFGVDLVYGKNIAPDLNRGLALIEKAAAQKHPAALYQLGTIYDNGDFARQNLARAAELMAGAAQARYWQAEY